MCSGFAPPKVAICFAGAARTLQQPTVYRSIKTNLIDAFGGDTTIFAALKLEDERGDRRPEFGGLIATERDKVMHALHHLGLKRPEHAIVTEAAALPNSRLPVCGTPSYAQSGRAHDLFDSLVGQLNNRHACHDLISAEEERSGSAFVYVIYTRPDLSWPLPLWPHCYWDLGRTQKKWDWVIFLTREDARTNLEFVANELWTCSRLPFEEAWSPDGMQLPEFYMAEVFHGGEVDHYAGPVSAIPTRRNAPNMPSLCELPDSWYANHDLCAPITYANQCTNL